MQDFFLSYNLHDKAWAEWLAWTLEEAGFTVIVEAWDFQPGGNFALYMDRAVREAKQTIAVLSQHFLDANYVHPEWAAAFARDPQGLKRKLIPVRVGECQPEGLLAQIVYVDMVGVPEVEAKQRLLNGLKERARPDQKPSFPGAVVPKGERTEPQPVAFPGIEATADLSLKLQPFEFDVVTVSLEEQTLKNPRGSIGLFGSPFEVRVNVKLTARKGQAQSFTEDLSNGVGLEMVSITGGRFFMGAPEAEAGFQNRDRPQHLVRVSPFCMGKYPVTQEQWLMVSELPKVNHDLDPDCSGFKGFQCPVERVSWWEAVEFCDRLSRKTGREYRLPSEAEWEYACRAGTTTPFYFGETLTTDLANYGRSRQQTTDVGSFPPNAFGLYDMHGNIWEWCADHWHANYQGAPTDGSAWLEGGASEDRVRRGGSWRSTPRYCRSTSRDFNERNDRDYNDFGFRVVCSAP